MLYRLIFEKLEKGTDHRCRHDPLGAVGEHHLQWPGRPVFQLVFRGA